MSLDGKQGRVESLDLLRGLIMVLMVIDHVRVYTGIPPGGPEPAVFFTRWVTHFCAPGFAFFAGVAAFFHGVKLGSTSSLSKYLVTRGLMLVVFEITIVRFGWTFNLNLGDFMLAGIIWMLGWSMLLLGAVVRLNSQTIGMMGLCIILLQQLFAYVSPALPDFLKPYWEFIYPSGAEGPGWIAILYVIVPWVGVMMAGYGFGNIMSMEARKRDRWCYIIGLTSIVIFVAVGGYYAVNSKDETPFIQLLLNQKKYPASQLYLMMTLGPLITLIPFAEKAKGAMADFFRLLGRVPLFFYLTHLPLIHLSAFVVNYFLFGSIHQEWYLFAPFAQVPPANVWSLALLYFVFVVDVAILYFLSKWYSTRKRKFI